MNIILSLAFAVVVILAVAWLIWRLAANRQSLPCPRWLGFILDNPLAGQEARKQILKAGLEPGMAVLDAGCGTGRLTIPIAQQVAPDGHVLAVDIQQEMLDTVAQRVRQHGLDNVFLRKLPLGEGLFHEHGIFDRAFLTTVLGEIPNRLQALQEIYTALKPGGVLSIAEIVVDPHFQNRARVRKLAEEAGFQIRAWYGVSLNFTAHLQKPGNNAA